MIKKFTFERTDLSSDDIDKKVCQINKLIEVSERLLGRRNDK